MLYSPETGCSRAVSVLSPDHADAKSARVLARFVGTVCSAEINQDLGEIFLFNLETQLPQDNSRKKPPPFFPSRST